MNHMGIILRFQFLSQYRYPVMLSYFVPIAVFDDISTYNVLNQSFVFLFVNILQMRSLISPNSFTEKVCSFQNLVRIITFVC